MNVKTRIFATLKTAHTIELNQRTVIELRLGKNVLSY